MSAEQILRTENLWKTYRSGKVEVSALRGVNFEVMPGEFVAVVGPSGCGKSTLLYVVGGLTQASRGKVFVDGNDLTAIGDAARTKLRRHRSASFSSALICCRLWTLLATSPSR